MFDRQGLKLWKCRQRTAYPRLSCCVGCGRAFAHLSTDTKEDERTGCEQGGMVCQKAECFRHQALEVERAPEHNGGIGSHINGRTNRTQIDYQARLFEHLRD